MTDGSTTWTFTYDAGGMRTQRTNGSRTDKYVYNGGLLMQMKRGTANTLDFIYDAAGLPTAVSLNGTLYYYITNLQGDITAIVDTTGATVVTHTYDAWGKNLGISGSMASTLGQYNPLRYRGYVYDQETGLYYLQTRYYDPKIGRFINADGLISTGQGLLGDNMFAYCGNNPVMRVDITGKTWDWSEIKEKIKEWFGKVKNFIEEVVETSSQLIDNQYNASIASIPFGKGTVGENGCGVVAIHNVKVLCGVDSTIVGTIDDIERNDGFFLWGYLGMNPEVVDEVLAESGIACTPVTFNEFQQPGLYLIMYWNNPLDIFEGAHYVVVQYDGETSIVYNGKDGYPIEYYSNYIYGYRIG